MRVTPALYVRQWLAKLHPPLPQTPRESQQLLRILEGSFRKHLDEVHPPPTQGRIPASSHLDIPLAPVESSSSATHHYFNTVLNNPLLARPTERNSTRPSSTAAAVSTFVTALNEGSVTISLVRRCAIQYLQALKDGEDVADKDRFADKIASWMYIASPASRMAFFASAETLSLAVQVAAVDQDEAIAWDWLRILYERKFNMTSNVEHESIVDLKWLSAEDIMVSHLMQLSIRRGETNIAAQQFVEACQYRSLSGRGAVRLQDVSKDLTYLPLEHSWKRLAASIIHYRSKHGISEELFTRAMSYGATWSMAPEFSIPVLQVYHPTSPSAFSLSQQLQAQESANQFLSKQVKASKRSRRAMLMMILDGAHTSLDQGYQQQAQYLLDFARTHYTEYLPPIPQKAAPSLDTQIRHARGELKAHSYNFTWT